MLTVIIKNDGEDNVVQLTYENLWHELKDIPGSELIVSKNWFDELPSIKNNYVCFVEADCLINKGYFIKQLKEFRTNPGRKISMLTAKTSVKNWDNCFYGYSIDYKFNNYVVPNRFKKSSSAYPVEVGYLPGAIIRLSMLREVLNSLPINDLVLLSTQLSLAFWRQGLGGQNGQNGNPVYINPNVTYVTTEDYVNDIGKFDFDPTDLQDKFIRESV
jgi:hypothetical protein